MMPLLYHSLTTLPAMKNIQMHFTNNESINNCKLLFLLNVFKKGQEAQLKYSSLAKSQLLRLSHKS